MNTQSPPKSAEELIDLARSLQYEGFDHAYIYGKMRSMTNDSELTAKIISQIRSNNEHARTRVYALNGISQEPPNDGYFSLGIGIFLIMFGFFIKSFIATVGAVSMLPYLIMGIGVFIALRHFVAPA